MSSIYDIFRSSQLGVNYRSKRLYSHRNVIKLFGLDCEKDLHSGCVNCLDWSDNGTLLASGSDDRKIAIYNFYSDKKLITLGTPHLQNIFGVKFFPENNNYLGSCAADRKVIIYDIAEQRVVHSCQEHEDRVKMLEVLPRDSRSLISCSEDGTVLHIDYRSQDVKTLVNLRKTYNTNLNCGNIWRTSVLTEVKCININKSDPNYLAVGSNDAVVRVYDRRFIRDALDTVETFLPLEVIKNRLRNERFYVTCVCFSEDGKELLCSYGNDQIYLMDFSYGKKSDAENAGRLYSSSAYNVSPGSTAAGGGHSHLSLEPLMKKILNIQRCPKTASLKNTNISNSSIFPPNASTSTVAPSLEKLADNYRLQGNSAYNKHDYSLAIHLYSKGIYLNPHSSKLLANRATALLRRKWRGDCLAALLDSLKAISSDPHSSRSYVRLTESLFELDLLEEGIFVADIAQQKFPSGNFFENTSAKMKKCLLSSREKREGKHKQSVDRSVNLKSAGRGANPKKRSAASLSPVHQRDSSATASCAKTENITSDDEENSVKADEEEHIDNTIARLAGALSGVLSLLPKARYFGHCNVDTDIKQAVFYGSCIMGGSDDGRMFMWDKGSGLLLGVVKADQYIVNCILPHPWDPVVATSGIENNVKFWRPSSKPMVEFRTSELLYVCNQNQGHQEELRENATRIFSVQDIFQRAAAEGNITCTTS
ncbi:DDB1- and CUL4-associated factor 6-like isoform X2 [Zophobas morio]|jgi:WD and tetratricopeptide repeat-containing protein 1|uniref:DDB1- and CUL4-associated factor 6-like isoform X2 n=1 Tax=Zophobas morio TaxID=2755281 RepID=UPI003082A55D